jgi:hypothetical protein
MSRFGVGESLQGVPVYLSGDFSATMGRSVSEDILSELGGYKDFLPVFQTWAKGSILANRSQSRFRTLPFWVKLQQNNFDIISTYASYGKLEQKVNKKRFQDAVKVYTSISLDLIEVLLGYQQGTSQTYYRLFIRLNEWLAARTGNLLRPAGERKNLSFAGENNNKVDNPVQEGGDFRSSSGGRGILIGLEHYTKEHKEYGKQWSLLAYATLCLTLKLVELCSDIEKYGNIRQRRCAFAERMNETLPGELTLDNGMVMRSETTGQSSTLDLMNWNKAPVAIRLASGWFVGMDKFIEDCMKIEGYVPPVDRNTYLTSYDAPPESKARDFDARAMFQQQTAVKVAAPKFGAAIEFKAKKEAEAQAVVEQAAAEEAAAAEQAAVEQKKSSAVKKSSLVLLAAAGVGAYLMTKS